jgi:hypothetical protein
MKTGAKNRQPVENSLSGQLGGPLASRICYCVNGEALLPLLMIYTLVYMSTVVVNFKGIGALSFQKKE